MRICGQLLLLYNDPILCEWLSWIPVLHGACCMPTGGKLSAIHFTFTWHTVKHEQVHSHVCVYLCSCVTWLHPYQCSWTLSMLSAYNHWCNGNATRAPTCQVILHVFSINGMCYVSCIKTNMGVNCTLMFEQVGWDCGKFDRIRRYLHTPHSVCDHRSF